MRHVPLQIPTNFRVPAEYLASQAYKGTIGCRRSHLGSSLSLRAPRAPADFLPRARSDREQDHLVSRPKKSTFPPKNSSQVTLQIDPPRPICRLFPGDVRPLLLETKSPPLFLEGLSIPQTNCGSKTGLSEGPQCLSISLMLTPLLSEIPPPGL